MSRFFTLSKSVFFAIAIAIAFLPSLHAEQTVKSDGEKTTVIAQLSDPQFYFSSSTVQITEEESEKRAKAAVQYVNQLKPDAVVITGDLIQTPGDKKQTETFWRIFSQLDPSIPLYRLPGNHDVELTANSLASYRENFGKDYYSFSIGPDRFIALNSMLLRKEAAKMDEATKHWNWIEVELKKAKAENTRHVVLFLHHPIFVKKTDEAYAYFNLPEASRKRLFQLFEQHKVDAVFSGHHHRNGVNQHQGVDYIITSSVCAPFDGEPAGLRIIKLTPNGITHRYIAVPKGKE